MMKEKTRDRKKGKEKKNSCIKAIPLLAMPFPLFEHLFRVGRSSLSCTHPKDQPHRLLVLLVLRIRVRHHPSDKSL